MTKPKAQWGPQPAAPATVLAIDVSSFHLCGCLMVDRGNWSLCSRTLGRRNDPPLERIRHVRQAMADLIAGEPPPPPQPGARHVPTKRRPVPDWIVIEDTFGASGRARKSLDRTTGAILAAVPDECQRATIATYDWRHALDAKNTKEAGHDAVCDALGIVVRSAYTEHELDAIGIALAWSVILTRNLRDP